MKSFIVRGGKRQRPYLAYLAYKGMNGAHDREFLKTASGLEIFHNFLLVHDDVIDRDHIRYAGPNLTAIYFALLKEQGHDDDEASHFAEMAALLAGDIASSMFREEIISSSFSAEQKLAVISHFDEALFEVGAGEFLDALAIPLGETPLSYERILTISRYKTAGYSFGLPLHFGAILSGSSYNTEAVNAFAYPLGIGFQMRDDVIGLFGDPSITGKTVMGDLREGKQTALYALAQQMATPEKMSQVSAVYGKRDANEADLDTIRNIFQDCGALEAVELEITQYAETALSMLESIGFTHEVATELRALISKSLYRHV
jgi:geranylgeranyl pyrophosphate synthase